MKEQPSSRAWAEYLETLHLVSLPPGLGLVRGHVGVGGGVWVDSGDVKEDGLVEGGYLPIREKMGKILPHHTGHTVVAACVATQQLADTVVPHCESFALELLADEGMPWCVHHVFATQAADERQVVQGRETKAKAESNGCGEVRDDMERRGRLSQRLTLCRQAARRTRS